MGHTAQGTKAKSYKVNTPESKAIGNITENMVKTSAFNLNAGTVNNLFTGYGLNTPTLDVTNEGVKVYDGHKSDFKFNEDALKEIVKPRDPTVEEINLSKSKAVTETKIEEGKQLDIETENIDKRTTVAKKLLEVEPLEEEVRIKNLQEKEADKVLKRKLKEEGNLIPNPENTIPEEDIKKLKAQGLWDIITGVADKGSKILVGALGVETARQLITDPVAFSKEVLIDTALERGIGTGPGAVVGFSLAPTKMGTATLNESQVGEYKRIPLEEEEGFIKQNQIGR